MRGPLEMMLTAATQVQAQLRWRGAAHGFGTRLPGGNLGTGDFGFDGLEEVLSRPEIRRLREILAERADVVVTVSEPEGRLLWGSQTGSLSMFGRAPSSFEGQSVYAYVHPDDVAHVRRSFQRAMEDDTANYAARGRAEDGSWRRVILLTWRTDGPSGPALVTIALPADTPPDDLGYLPSLGRRVRGNDGT